MKYDKDELNEVEAVLNVRPPCATVQNRLLLQRRVPEVGVEEAQEDVQGTDEGGRRMRENCGFFMRAIRRSDPK